MKGKESYSNYDDSEGIINHVNGINKVGGDLLLE